MEIFLTIAILHLFAVASPGPDFLLVTRQCLRFDRTVAIWASAGIATGILFHSFIAITGVTLIISSNPEVFRWLKVLASIYIAYLGYLSIFKSSIIKSGKWPAIFSATSPVLYAKKGIP